MLGKAQKLYFEKGGSSSAMSKLCSPWQRIYECMPYVDYALACLLLKDHPDADEGAAALIAYLSLAARAGHLCVSINGCTLMPDPANLLENIESEELSQLILQGVKTLPLSLLTDVVSSDVDRCPTSPVCKLGNFLYLQRYWRQESTVIKHFQNVADIPPAIALDLCKVNESLQILEQQHKLLPEQAAAIRIACANSLSIICGGPGTGKTYTAGELIKIYWATMSEQQRQRCEIALAAPTGKAAANLQKSLKRAVGDIAGFPSVQAKTLHALLGVRGTRLRKDDRKLTADLILVDESSMIDVHLMAYLLAAIKPGARLILLGDRHQLPPVSAGMLFGDLMARPNDRCVELKTCLRSDLRSIVDFASTINCGNSDEALNILTDGKNGISRLHFEALTVKGIQKAIVDYAMPFFMEGLSGEPQKLLEAFNKFRILSPLRQGPYGVDALNELFMYCLKYAMRSQEWFVTPILLSTNDHRLELSNGEAGILVRRNAKDRQEGILQEGDYALFSDRDAEHAVRRIPALLLPQYEYGYCLSVHKSQGSEFDRVLLLMPEGAERFGREVLYTGVTRARKQLDIWGSDVTIRKTIQQPSHRLSGLSQRLR